MNAATTQPFQDSDTLVIIIHWNAIDWCVRAAKSFMESEEISLQLLVVDVASTGGPELARRLPAKAIIVETPENCGYAGAANLGIEWGANNGLSGPIVLASHDTIVGKNTLANLSAALAGPPLWGIVGPILEEPLLAGGWWRWGLPTYARELPPRIDASYSPASNLVLPRGWVSGACMMIALECARSVGPMLEALHSYVEDVEYCARAEHLGWGVGIVVGARASTLGRVGGDVTNRVARNTIWVGYARRSWGGALLTVIRLLGRMARTWVAAWILVGRDRERRSSSRLRTRAYASGISMGVSGLSSRQFRRRLRDQWVKTTSTTPAGGA
jgi:GT2 family glycosyltransferase